jgi:hypothetical protein
MEMGALLFVVDFCQAGNVIPEILGSVRWLHIYN